MTDNEIADKLDGLEIGNLGINRCTAVNDVWLTVYDNCHSEDEYIEQITMSPAELVAFCRKVVEVVEVVEPVNPLYATTYRLVRETDTGRVVYHEGSLVQCRLEYETHKRILPIFDPSEWIIEQVTERMVKVEKEPA